MTISQELQLDASSAEQTIQDIDGQLQQVAELFKVALADAMSILGQPLIVPVAADTTQAAEDIGSLAQQPPVDVPVAADTAPASEEIQAFLDTLPPFELTPVADLGPSRAEIDAFESEIQSTEAVITVEADTSNATNEVSQLGSASESSAGEVGHLEGSVSALGAAAGVAEGSARELVSAVGEMGGESGKAAAGGVLVLTGAVTGFFEEGIKAVSAGQRFDMIVGQMKEDIEKVNIDGLDTSMEKLGLQFGSTGAEMENANSKLFQFAINAGASQEQAVQFTQQVEALSARAISLNPQLGTLDSVMETLGPKLARGGRFASEFGIALTPAEINARALTDTGKSLNSELTVQEKAMAGAEIASEKYADTLAATVAQGSQNAQVKLESLTAGFKEAIEQIGVPIVAPVFDILHAGLPEAEQVAEVLGELAKDALPAVQVALDLIGPPLQLVSFVLDHIPGPIVAGTVAFYGFSAALDAVAGALLGEGVAFAAVQPELALLAGGLAIAAAAVSFFGGQQADAVKPSEDLVRALKDEKGAADEATGAIEAKALADDKGARTAHDAGVSFDLMNKTIQEGTDNFGAYAQAASALTDLKPDEIVTRLKAAGAESTEFGKSLIALAASGQLSQHQLVEYIDTIGRLHGEFAASKTVAAAEITSTNEISKSQAAAEAQAQALQEALQGVLGTNEDLVSSFNAVTSRTGDVNTNLEQLAIGLDKAGVSGKDLDTVAQGLGVTSDQLKGFIKDVTSELDSFVSTAVQKLPSVSTAIDDALDPKAHQDKPIIVDPKKLQDEIGRALFQIGVFNSQLADLQARGLDNLAKVAAERGPEFTNALVQSIKGKDETAHALDDQFGQLNQATRLEADNLRTAGAGIINATGDVAAAASKNFGDKFVLVEPTQAQLDAAKTIARQEQIPFSQALGQVAGQGAVAYEQKIGAIGPSTTTALAGAESAIDMSADPLGAKAQNAGGSISSSFQVGTSGIPGIAGAAFQGGGGQIINASFALAELARVGGVAIGQALDGGIIWGLIGPLAQQVANAAASVVDGAIGAAKSHAHVASPSKVMIELGQQMAEGLAIGLGDTDGVKAAGSALAAAGIPDLQSAGAALGSTAAATAGQFAGLGGGDGGALFRDFVVHVDGAGMTQLEARQIGQTVGNVAADRFAAVTRRRVATSVKVS